MESLIKEFEFNYKRGQTIKYFDNIGKIKIGKYMMAGDKEGTIVVKNERGEVELVEISKIWPPVVK